MRNKRTVFSDFSGRIIGTLMLAAVALVLTVSLSARAYGADENGALLAGTVKSDSGEKMSGVTVSAKAEGRTITTSVFTDQQGDYYFPPLTPGAYEVWAQADTFETARAKVDLTATRHQDFALKHLKDFQRQLTGDQLLASLPDGTPDDRRLARIFRNSCTSCHQPNYILQERFDTAGWTSILDLMKRVTVAGGYLGEKSEAAPIIDFHEKELATYLARISGPGPTAMKFKLRSRPTGEAARAVFTEYDVPIAPDEKAGTEYISNDGSDWSLGTPSSLSGAHGIHDAQADLQGNIWFSYNVSNHDISLGRVDAKTGALKTFKIAGLHGYAANGHGLARDRQGILWFNMSAGVEGGPGAPGENRSGYRTDQGVHGARGHDRANRGRRNRGRRWQRQNLGHHRAGRGALRSRDGEVHGVQIADIQKRGWHRKYLRTRRGRRRKWLVGADEHGHDVQERHQVRQSDAGQNPSRRKRNGSGYTGRAQSLCGRRIDLDYRRAVGGRAASFGRGQEWARSVGLRLVGREPRQDRYPHVEGNDDSASQAGRAAAVSSASGFKP